MIMVTGGGGKNKILNHRGVVQFDENGEKKNIFANDHHQLIN